MSFLDPRRVNRWLTALVVTTGLLAGASWPGVAQAPRVVWERTYGAEGEWWEYNAGCVAAGNQLQLAVATSPSPLLSQPPSRSVTSLAVAPDGSTVAMLPVENPPLEPGLGLTNFSIALAHSLQPAPSGQLTLGLEFVEGHAWSVSLDPSGVPTTHTRLDLGSGQLALRQLLPLTNGDLVAVGSVGQAAMASRLTAAGRVVWEKRYDWQGIGRLDQAREIGSDRIAVIGSAGMYDLLGRGPSGIHLLLLDAGGGTVAQRVFPGRRGALASAGPEQLVALYDKGEGDTQEIRVKTFRASDLQETAEWPVSAGGRGVGEYRLQAGKNGAVLIAGAQDGRLFFARLDPTKGVLWSGIVDGVGKAREFDLLSARDGNLYVVCSTFVPHPTWKMERKVKVIKLTEP